MRLLALDLDGTVFGDDLVISPRLLEAIAAAQAHGVIVTIATGRMFGPARQIAVRLSIEQPLICYQGALVGHSATGEVLYHKTVPLEFAHAIIAEATRQGLHLNVYLNDNIYVSRITPEAEYYSKINMNEPLNEVGNMHAWLHAQGGAEPTKLVIISAAERTDGILADFTRQFGQHLQVTKSHPRFTEFTSAECSKGRAMAFLAAHCGVAQAEVMAIGDGLNDLDMLAWAGYGVAMSTSPQIVLDAAHIVTGSLAEDGAADAIERYVLS